MKFDIITCYNNIIIAHTRSRVNQLALMRIDLSRLQEESMSCGSGNTYYNIIIIMILNFVPLPANAYAVPHN